MTFIQTEFFITFTYLAVQKNNTNELNGIHSEQTMYITLISNEQ